MAYNNIFSALAVIVAVLAASLTAADAAVQDITDELGRRGLDFNGGQDLVVIPSVNFQANSGVTIDIVFKQSSSANQDGARIFQFQRGDGSYFTLMGDASSNVNRIAFKSSVKTPSGESEGTLSQNSFDIALDSWHRAVLVLKAEGTSSLFIDGNLLSSSSLLLPTGSLSSNVLGGGVQDNTGFTGRLALFRYYAVDATTDEVQALFSSLAEPDRLAQAKQVEYRLDDGFGRIIQDSSPNNRDGRMAGFPQWFGFPNVIDQLARTSLEFRNNPDKVVIPPFTFDGGAMTLSIIVKFARIDRAYDRIAVLRESDSLWNHVGLLQDGHFENYRLKFEYRPDNPNGAVCGGTGEFCVYAITSDRVATVPDTWYHILATVSEAGDAAMYVNGSLVAEGSLSGTLPSFDVRAGALGGDGGNLDNANIKGSIASLKLYKRALSLDEIKQDLTNVLFTAGSDEKIAYRFNEETGTVIIDTSPSKLHGSLAGFPIWSSHDVKNRLRAMAYAHMNFRGEERLTIGDAEVPDEFSMEAVVKVGSRDGYQFIFTLVHSAENIEHIALLMDPSKVIFFEIRKIVNGQTSYHTLYPGHFNFVDGQYHHIMATVSSSGSGSLYVDGSLVASGDLPQWTQGTYTWNQVGARFGNVEPFGGSVGLARFYNKAFTADQVFALMRPTIWAYRQDFGVFQPAFLNTAENTVASISFAGTDPQNRAVVVEEVSGFTYTAAGGGAVEVDACEDGKFAVLQIGTATATYDATGFNIYIHVQGQNGRIDRAVVFNAFRLGETKEAAFCYPSSLGSFVSLTIENPVNDGWMFKYAYLRFPEQPFLAWDSSIWLKPQDRPSITLHAADSSNPDSIHCVEGEELQFNFFIAVKDAAFAGASFSYGQASVQFSGSQGTSNPFILGSSFSRGQVARFLRCVPTSIGVFQQFTLQYTSDDGFIVDYFGLSFGTDAAAETAPSLKWTIDHFIDSDFTNTVTLSIGDHDDVDIDSCLATRFVTLRVFGTASTNDVFIDFKMTGSNGDSHTLHFTDGVYTTEPEVYERCLASNIGNFNNITVINNNSDAWDFDRLEVFYQGAFYAWQNTNGELAGSQSFVFHATESTLNPVMVLANSTLCTREETCTLLENATCASALDWKLFYESDFSTGHSDGWIGTAVYAADLTPVVCGSFGPVLGAHQLGANSELYRTQTALPEHTHVRIRMDVAKIDSFDYENILVFADGVQVYAKQFGAATEAQSFQCGQSAGDVWRDAIDALDVVIPHTSTTLTVRVASTIDQGPHDESFGIRSAEFFFTTLTSDVLLSETYAEGMNDGAEWVVIGAVDGKDMLPISTCGMLGSALGPVSSDNQALSRCVSNINKHAYAIIELDLIYFDIPETRPPLYVEVDGTILWESGSLVAAGHALGDQICGDPELLDLRVRIRERLLHSSDAMNVVVFSNGEGSVGIQSFRVLYGNETHFCNGEPASSPLPPPAPEYTDNVPMPLVNESCADYPYFACQGTEDCTLLFNWDLVSFSDFSDGNVGPWTSQNAHTCDGLSVGTCGDFGFILGGTRQIERGTSVEAVLRKLSAHTAIRLAFTFVLIDSWDAERIIISVDGADIYTSPALGWWTYGSENQCGSEFFYDGTFSVSLTILHTAASANISIRTTIDQIRGDEALALGSYAFSIANVATDFYPVVTLSPPRPALWSPYAGVGLVESATCSAAGEEVTFVSVSHNPSTSEGLELTRVVHGLDGHTFLTLEIVLIHQQGAVTGVDVFVDGTGSTFSWALDNRDGNDGMSGDRLPEGFALADAGPCMHSTGSAASSLQMVRLVATVFHATPSAALRIRPRVNASALASGTTQSRFVPVFGVAGVVISVNANPVSCACAEDEYLSPTSSSCEPCDVTCRSCNGTHSSQCLTCPSGSYFDSGRCTPCTTSCPEGFYLSRECGERSDGICSRCDAACQSCSTGSALGCSECAPGFGRLVEGSDMCVQHCEADEARNGTACVSCPETCTACEVSSADATAVECSACVTGLHLAADGTCGVGCPEGTYPEINTRSCEPCADVCSSCTGPTSGECSSCATALVELTTTGSGGDDVISCVASCPPTHFLLPGSSMCEECSSGSDACGDAMYVEQECSATADVSCAACAPGCRHCAPLTGECFACVEGFYLDEARGQCRTCRADCARNQFMIPICEGAHDNICVDCDESCNECTSTGSGNCVACAAGYETADGGLCVPMTTTTTTLTTTTTTTTTTASQSPDSQGSQGGQTIGGLPAWIVAVLAVLVFLLLMMVVVVFFLLFRKKRVVAFSQTPTSTFENPVYQASRSGDSAHRDFYHDVNESTYDTVGMKDKYGIENDADFQDPGYLDVHA